MDFADFQKKINKDKKKMEHPAKIYVVPITEFLDKYPQIELKQKMRLISGWLQGRVTRRN
jgi:hypothetical protein